MQLGSVTLMGDVATRAIAAGTCLLVLLVASGCGGDSKTSSVDAGPSEALRASAVSLQGAMDTSSRAIDGVRGTRDSLERLGSSLEPAIAQTGDVIGVLTPKAGTDTTESKLLNAARQQRSFLQFAADSTKARTRSAANSALKRARDAGRRASTAYADIAQATSALAGVLPASTTFNTGRLSDAVHNVNKKKSSKSGSDASKGSGSSGGGSNKASSSCGDGISVNSVTSCPFARNVADVYRSSGGASVIDVYSPVTGTTYTMSCTSGIPTVCSGGNGAVVYIR